MHEKVDGESQDMHNKTINQETKTRERRSTIRSVSKQLAFSLKLEHVTRSENSRGIVRISSQVPKLRDTAV